MKTWVIIADNWNPGMEYAWSTQSGDAIETLAELELIDPKLLRWASGEPVWAAPEQPLVVRERPS